MTRASLAREPADVAAMFDEVAPRYDLTNAVLSLGLVGRWRTAVLRTVAARPGDAVLDVAAGTGTSAVGFAAAGARVVSCDFSLGMLRVGRRRHPDLPFVAGDALRLPFADAAYDAVTISFGLRNVADPDAALREFRRVTRPGGRLVVCEFSAPVEPLLRPAYRAYLLRVLPALARAVSSDPAAYGYLAESIAEWPDQRGLAARIALAGWDRISWRSLAGGIVAVHTAVAPA